MTPASFIHPFEKLTNRDVALAGGKGASLGEMTRAKLQVPPGFVVGADAFDRFTVEADLGVEIERALERVNPANLNSVEVASHRLQALIVNAKMPPDIATAVLIAYNALAKKLKTKKLFVAVRSSATAEDSAIASWAGELETYLDTTRETLLENVQKCWASLFTPRAIVYGCEKGVWPQYENASRSIRGRPQYENASRSIRGRRPTLALRKKARVQIMGVTCPVKVAVVVQAMVPSERAGVCFTVHPVTEDPHQMVIESVFGLGEALVGGAVTPDTYVVDKRDLALVDVNIGEQTHMIVRAPQGGTREIKLTATKGGKQKLTGREITDLARLCRRVETHYGRPMDIEWAYAKGMFYLLQARPITTLSKSS